ncbi:MAG: hypothetical protein ACFHWX_21060 [Bacteroidota bacterium]
MLSDQEKQDYIDIVENRIFFYIEAKFWSKPKLNQFRAWLSNFKSLDEKYFAFKLLDNFVYYSEEDIAALLQYGLEEKIFKRKILHADLNSKFCILNNELDKIREEFISKTAIMPLRSDNASSSGPQIVRYLTNDLGFPEEQVLFNDKLSKKLILDKYDRILIVDDFIGTGDQIIDFWNYDKFSFEGESLSMYEIRDSLNKDHYNVDFEYLCVVATSKGIARFYAGDAGFRNDLSITYCEELNEKFIIFGSNSIYFDNDEIDTAKKILSEVCSNANLNFLGFSGLNYALAFHHSIPDSSLPLFYTKNENWHFLFRNKLTIDVLP